MNIYCIRPKGFNIGNDVIFLAMRHFIEKALGFTPNLIELPATSKYDGDRAGLTAKTIYEINQFGNGVIIGGGNLYENNELDVDLNALDKLSVPLFLYSLSCGRVYNKKGKLRTRTDTMPDNKIVALRDKAFLSTARDEATQKYIDRNILVGCPTIFLNKIYPAKGQETDITLLSIRNPSLMNIPVSKKNEVVDCIKEIIKTYKNVKILCHDYRDIPFAESLDAEYIYTENALTFLAILKSCKLNISFRLHSTLPCLSYDKPVINISYDERALSLMNTIGFKEWDINIMNTDDLIGIIQNRVLNFDRLENLKNNNQPLWDDYYNITLKLFKSFTKEMV